MKKIYISGPITNDPQNFRKHFEDMEAYLKRLGYDVLNPADKNTDQLALKLPKGMSLFDKKAWLYFMERDIHWVADCDAIMMLKGWRESPGAQIEYWVAKKYELDIMFEEDVEDDFN